MRIKNLYENVHLDEQEYKIIVDFDHENCTVDEFKQDASEMYRYAANYDAPIFINGVEFNDKEEAGKEMLRLIQPRIDAKKKAKEKWEKHTWKNGPYAKIAEMVPVWWLKKLKGNNLRDTVNIGYNPDAEDWERSEDLNDLVKSLKERGVQEPVTIIVGMRDGYAYIGEGNHRIAAAEMAGFSHMPARVYVQNDANYDRGFGTFTHNVVDDLTWNPDELKSFPEEKYYQKPSQVFKSLKGKIKESVLKEFRLGDEIVKKATINQMKAIAKNSDDNYARFVCHDGVFDAADGYKFTHYDIYPLQKGFRGWIYHNKGVYTYRAVGIFNSIPVEDPMLDRLERMGIHRRVDEVNEDTRLTKTDKQVIDAFLRQETAENKKLLSDGETLEGLWMGGKDIAYWKGNRLIMGNLDSRSKQTIQRYIKRTGISIFDMPPIGLYTGTTGASHGQTDGMVWAYNKDIQPRGFDPNGGGILGYISWAEYEGETQIQMIKVHKDYQRLGIGSMMVKELKKTAKKVVWSGTTTDGEALKQSLGEQNLNEKAYKLRIGNNNASVLYAPTKTTLQNFIGRKLKARYENIFDEDDEFTNSYRGIIYDNKLIVWDAWDATHADVVTELGIDSNGRGTASSMFGYIPTMNGLSTFEFYIGNDRDDPWYIRWLHGEDTSSKAYKQLASVLEFWGQKIRENATDLVENLNDQFGVETPTTQMLVKKWAKKGYNKQYILSQLKAGIKVELEHTKDKALASEIARDHLDEFPDYYTRLAKMEKEPIDNLNEFKVSVGRNNTPVDVLKNPTRKILQHALEKYGSLRGLWNDNEFFFWDANSEIHFNMAKKIGLEYDDTKRLGVGGKRTEWELDFDESHWLELLKNPYVKKVFDIGGQDEFTLPRLTELTESYEWDLDGYWITDTQDIINVDHNKDIHHADIAIDKFGEYMDIGDEDIDIYEDEWCREQAMDMAIDDSGWIRVSTSKNAGSFGFDMKQYAVSKQSLMLLRRMINQDQEWNMYIDTYGENKFDNKRDVLRYLGKLINEKRMPRS